MSVPSQEDGGSAARPNEVRMNVAIAHANLLNSINTHLSLSARTRKLLRRFLLVLLLTLPCIAFALGAE